MVTALIGVGALRLAVAFSWSVPGLAALLLLPVAAPAAAGECSLAVEAGP